MGNRIAKVAMGCEFGVTCLFHCSIVLLTLFILSTCFESGRMQSTVIQFASHFAMKLGLILLFQPDTLTQVCLARGVAPNVRFSLHFSIENDILQTEVLPLNQLDRSE
jgi:hypothetical protein